MKALTVIQRYFPGVKKLADARRGLDIEVQEQDRKGARRKSLGDCAMARACVRSQGCDGALVSPSRVYLVDRTLATRYSVPPSVSREIVSFDRAGGFATGEYHLLPIAKTARLGTRRGKGGGAKTGTATRARRHITVGIRHFA